MHCQKDKGQTNRGNHQLLLILISWSNNRLDLSRVSIEELIGIPFVVNLKILNKFLGFVPNEDIEGDESTEHIFVLKNYLRFVANLDMLIFKEGTPLLEIAQFESLYPLILLHIKHNFCQILARIYHLPLEIFWLYVAIWRI